MIIDKIVYNQPLTLEEIKILLKMYFKIKQTDVKSSSLDMFIKYMTTLNEHPFISDFNRFRPLGIIIQEDLVPTITNYIDLLKVYGKNSELITFNYNKEKYLNIN